MARTLFFHMVLRNFSEIANNKPVFSQYNIFCNHEYFFFQSIFWSLFNRRQRSQSNHEQCSLCCRSPCFRVLLCTHYGLLQCFWKYFHKLEFYEIRVLWSYLPTMLFLVTMFIHFPWKNNFLSLLIQVWIKWHFPLMCPFSYFLQIFV